MFLPRNTDYNKNLDNIIIAAFYHSKWLTQQHFVKSLSMLQSIYVPAFNIILCAKNTNAINNKIYSYNTLIAYNLEAK